MVGAPQSGAPVALGALLYGLDQGIFSKGITILSADVARELAVNSPMAYHLLPSGDYLESTAGDSTHPVARFAGAAYAKEISSYETTINNNTELEDFLRAQSLNSALIDYAGDQHDELDFWTPPSGVEVSQIAGWGADTVAGIDFYTPPPVSVAAALAPLRAYRPIFTEDGDGVVPIPSALLMATSSSVKRYWVNLFTYNRDSNTDRKHKDIFEIPSLQDFVKNTIENSTSTLPAYISTSQPATITDNKKLTFFLHSPLTLELIDSSGNVTGLADDGSMTQDIPGSTYGEFGEVKYIIAPVGNYSLTMNGQGGGTFSLDMQESLGGVITASSTIANVPTATSTLASLTISGGLETVSALTVDKDGDGTNVFTLTPQLGKTVNYELPTPTAPPVISSGGGGGWGGGVSFIVIATTTVATTTASTSSPQATIQPVATNTTEAVITTQKPIQIKKKQPVAVVIPKKAETNIPQTPLEIGFLTGQTASVYNASQQPLFARIGRAVYNGLYGLWLKLKSFF